MLSTAWRRAADGTCAPEWARIRDFADFYRAHPTLLSAAIEAAPPPSGSAAFDNLLAGFVEALADDADIPRPSWTSTVPPDVSDWPQWPAAVSRRWRRSAPLAMRARGLDVDSGTLWHTWDLYAAAP